MTFLAFWQEYPNNKITKLARPSLEAGKGNPSFELRHSNCKDIFTNEEVLRSGFYFSVHPKGQ